MSSTARRFGGTAAAALCSLLALGCAAPDDRPLGPGGGGIGPQDRPDAGTPGNIAYGRVCEVTSFSDRGPCKPLLNSDLSVSTFSSSAFLAADGSFEIEIVNVANEHVPLYVISTATWLGGTLAADAKEGEDLYQLEVPVMRRETANVVVANSGETILTGNGIIAVQTTSYAGVPLEGVSYGDVKGVAARYGGPDSYQAGTMTTSAGMAMYFDVGPGASGFNMPFNDGGTDFMTHGIVAPDGFTIIPVRLSR